MREIKFRAWDTKENKFETDLAMNLYGDLFDFNEGTADEGQIFWRDHYILQQSTGLKDKSGREIFEGDILETRYTKRIYKVYWGGIGWEPFEGNMNDPGDSHIYEIIGTVYENPELLEE